MDDYTTGSLLAYAALLAWPIVSFVLFRALRFFNAIVWTVLGALLLLPAQIAIKIPMVPALDKNSLASLSLSLGVLAFGRRNRADTTIGLVEVLAAFYVVGPIITSFGNGDPLQLGDRILPGVGAYDGISAALSAAISFLPFFVARRYLRDAGGNTAILRALALGGVALSLPMLFEIRMSPQLAQWIYGYFPSTFSVEMRNGGFRPVVFMNNGLTAAFYLATSIIAAAGLWRLRLVIMKLPMPVAVTYLSGVLVLCKSVGALVYAVALVPLVKWASAKWQIRVAVILASIALLYPTLRVSNYFPTDALVSLADHFSSERAQSLKFRFDNEEKMLLHAEERFLFGWGRYGRNRIFDETTGWESVTDGLWIITLGQFGLMGFIAQFGLCTLPVFRAAKAARFIRSVGELELLATLSLIVSITAVEQLPNASISPWTWLLSGALLGRAESILKASRVKPNALASSRSSPRSTQIRPKLT